MDNEPVVMRVERAAVILRIPADTIRRRILAGVIPATRIGGQWMIPTRYVANAPKEKQS